MSKKVRLDLCFCNPNITNNNVGKLELKRASLGGLGSSFSTSIFTPDSVFSMFTSRSGCETRSFKKTVMDSVVQGANFALTLNTMSTWETLEFSDEKKMIGAFKGCFPVCISTSIPAYTNPSVSRELL